MPKKQPVTWDGVTYDSLRDAARCITHNDKQGVSPHTLKAWLAHGFTCYADVLAAPGMRKGYAAEARELGVSRQEVQRRAKRERSKNK